MDTTLDLLPGEGEIKTTTRRHVRRTCCVCGEPAHYKKTFLYENYRSNPASSAYRHDDCSYCEDACAFVCREHLRADVKPERMEECSTFPASARFAHMLLHWEEVPDA
jgi:hypothetical protein